MKYNVGDKVRIKSLDWYNENKDEYGYINCGSRAFFTKMSNWCGKILTIRLVVEEFEYYCVSECIFSFTDEMIEGLVEEEKTIKAISTPVFNVGDYVFVKTLKEHPKNIKFRLFDYDTNRWMYSFDDETWFAEDAIVLVEGKTYDFLETYFNQSDNKTSLNDCMSFLNNEINLPQGYQFKDENGNVINATKIVLEKKKKEYPKTYEECCKVLHYAYGQEITMGGVTEEEEELFRCLILLKRCRDAYWKIAGEEMGLGKPWEPDWNNISDKYCIYFVSGDAWLKECQTRQCFFAFPTAEMRDAFYENFKEEIEFVKGLL